MTIHTLFPGQQSLLRSHLTLGTIYERITTQQVRDHADDALYTVLATQLDAISRRFATNLAVFSVASIAASDTGGCHIMRNGASTFLHCFGGLSHPLASLVTVVVVAVTTCPLR